MHAAAVTGEHPLEAIVDELRERASLLAPGVPVHFAEGDEVAARLAPGERVAGEEKSIIEQINDAAARVAGDRNREQPIANCDRVEASNQMRCVRRGRPVVLLDPDAGLEM